MCPNRIITILKKQVVKQAVEKRRRTEIVVIFNRYKDILDDFIDSLDLEILPRPIDKRFYNTPRSKSSLTSL